MTNGRRAIGLDIGGTKVAGAIVGEDGTVHAELRRNTPDTSDATTMNDLLRGMVEELRGGDAGDGVCAIGVGAAGTVEWPIGRIRWAPNNNYENWDLRGDLERMTGLPTVVDNDGNVAGLAEARLGERRFDDMLLLTVGTGVGAGIVLGGRIYRGAHGLGAEVGHMNVNPDGPQCGCGNFGCLESVASGTALTRMGRTAAAHDPDGMLAHLAAEDGGEVNGRHVTTAAMAGDPTAQSLFERLGRALGTGIAGLNAIFEFEVVLIGGGLVDAGELLLGPTRRAAREFHYGPPHVRPIPEVLPATYKGDAGKIGAGLLALEETIAPERAGLPSNE
ncbi:MULTISPECIES: ROK family protein [Pseudonocardia]|uniref:Glucokinase n=1 Tax=Pseudonocardia saturnea TaxID=33909 RepID=A0ABQ0S3S9_9PSEU|nr:MULTISPECIES: ROK family protein [Pseudonocardia]TDN72669.1 glucokinase [Pseudonocardia autotrophica]GEC27264.1 glucokinase [Pseudonocardia saturnea]